MSIRKALGAKPGSVVLVAVAIGTASPAAASSQMIVLESYSESRPEDADKLLVPLIGELRSRGCAANQELAARVNRRISMATQTLSEAELDEVKRLVSGGVAQYRDGNYEASVAKTKRAIRFLDSAPLTMVRSQETRDLMFDALIYLALANGRLGRTLAATRAMAELIRSFPDKEISHARHGPEPRQLFLKVKEDLKLQGVSRLAITLDDPRSVVFINERYVGVGSTVLENLFPGRYRVFVQQGERAGRRHEVDVQAGSDAAIDIVWGIDGALRTEKAFVGLIFTSELERSEREAGYVNRIARALDAPGVVVVGVRVYRGRRSIVGTSFAADSSRPNRTAVLAIEPVAPTEDQVRAMARFLAGDESAAKMFANRAGPERKQESKMVRPRPDDRGRPYRTWKWVGLLGGVVAIGTGVTLIAIDEPEIAGDHLNKTARSTKTLGIVTTAMGGVLTLAGAYFWIRDRKDARRSRVTLIPAQSGAVFAITGRF